MKIELKSIKHYESMSEETNCFQATIYIDGKRAGEASNRGYGDPINITPYELHKTINEYASTLPPIDYEGMRFEQDAETLIGDLLNDWLTTQDLKKLMAGRVVFLKDSKLKQSAKLNKEKLTEILASNSPLFQGGTILNNIPFAEAVKIYREFAQ
jgi:hypothetical protein